MSQADLISPFRFIAGLPQHLPRLPRLLRGLYYAGIRNRDKPLSLAWALERAAQRHAHRPALLDEHRQLSYAQFNSWANRLAWAFKAEGLRHGNVVAVMLENRLELLAILAALSKLGAVGALVNTTQRGKVLAHSLNLVKPDALVVGNELLEPYAEIAEQLENQAAPRYWVADQDCLDHPGQTPDGWVNPMQLARSQADGNLPDSASVRMKDPCFLIYTSGTTGLPKASIMSHGKWIKAYGGFGHSGLTLNEQDVLYLTLPCYHNNAVTVCWGAALAGGAAI
ncbi:AMP-binding protein, partial [Pseudomonas sp. CrR25]|nr:AMP-binding protein [Pseudomonas sp. CrR25]